MNRKEIITADLLARVQWEVKCEIDDSGDYTLGLKHLISAEKSHHEIKPILFSSLTAPITVAGETFVPIVAMFNLTYDKNSYIFGDFFESGNAVGFYGYWDQERKCKFRFTFHTERKSFYHTENHHEPIQNQHELFKFMYRNHINFELLPGEYIEATNEYA